MRSVAENLRPGGIYILGFHMIPMDADPNCTERWKAKDENFKVKAKLKVMDFNRDTRIENLRVTIKAKNKAGEVERVTSEFPLRIYTPKQAKKLFRKVSDVFEIAEAYDFDYDIDEERDFDNDLTDAVFVLRRLEESPSVEPVESESTNDLLEADSQGSHPDPASLNQFDCFFDVISDTTIFDFFLVVDHVATSRITIARLSDATNIDHEPLA